MLVVTGVGVTEPDVASPAGEPPVGCDISWENCRLYGVSITYSRSDTDRNASISANLGAPLDTGTGSLGVGATSLLRAVTDAVAEVHVAAQASHIVCTASKLIVLAVHALTASHLHETRQHSVVFVGSACKETFAREKEGGQRTTHAGVPSGKV